MPRTQTIEFALSPRPERDQDANGFGARHEQLFSGGGAASPRSRSKLLCAMNHVYTHLLA